jgi:pimeloyl-ACP methyl ester carboxylesterase
MSRIATAATSRAVPRLLLGAVALGVCAYVSRRMSRQALAQNPPQGRFVLADGVQLHYTEHGDPDRPPVVLVHGNGAMGREMAISGLVEVLVPSFRVLVFDRPGYGHSERPKARSYSPEAQATILLDALDTLGIERPIVLGHSWGAMVVQAMALAAPARLGAVVLVSGYYTATPRLDTLLLGAPAVPVLGPLMRHTVSPLIGRLLWPLMVRRIFAPRAVTERFSREYPVWMSLRPSQLLASAAEAGMMPLQAVKLKRREHELAVPTVIVAGDKDFLVMTRWQSKRLHQRVPSTHLRVIPGAGHMVHHTATAAVAEAVHEAWRLSAPTREAVSAAEAGPADVGPVEAQKLLAAVV